MKQRIYQVDAFTNRLFGGNPAAVCPLGEWLSDTTMQAIAMENNLSETAFVVKDGNIYQIRWFTPLVEVDLCGHATLAAAFVLFNHENHPGDTIHFFSPRSGNLKVRREGEILTLDFPADYPLEVEKTRELLLCFNIEPKFIFKGKTDYMMVFDSENQIKELQPEFQKITALNARGVIATARGEEVDFVSRFFAPAAGINEDPVTGSAHSTLAPYWSMVTGRNTLSALQLSRRGGSLRCTCSKDRVEISGQGKLYLTGEIFLE